jgi:hypothetical protein
MRPASCSFSRSFAKFNAFMFKSRKSASILISWLATTPNGRMIAISKFAEDASVMTTRSQVGDPNGAEQSRGD